MSDLEIIPLSLTSEFMLIDGENYLFKEINKQQMSDYVLLEDRGYLSESIQLNLFQTVNIKLETPKRTNQKDYKQQSYVFRKSRKRMETLFSQLCD